MRVFVLMGNDYPEAAIADEAAAEARAALLNEEDKKLAAREGRGRIYWRVYGFELDTAQ